MIMDLIVKIWIFTNVSDLLSAVKKNPWGPAGVCTKKYFIQNSPTIRILYVQEIGADWAKNRSIDGAKPDPQIFNSQFRFIGVRF